MSALLFLKSSLVGLSVAIPVGPVGLLCIRQSLTRGAFWGFISGLGAATADALYGALAAFGVTAINSFLIDYQHHIQLLGGTLLIYLGVHALLENRKNEIPTTSRSSLFQAFISSFFLTLSNPITLLLFVGIYAALGLGGDESGFGPFIAVSGIFIGSVIWWTLLSALFAVFQTKFTPSVINYLNLGSGALMTCCGFFAIGYSLLTLTHLTS